jgi:hypothetical protein
MIQLYSGDKARTLFYVIQFKIEAKVSFNSKNSLTDSARPWLSPLVIVGLDA